MSLSLFLLSLTSWAEGIKSSVISAGTVLMSEDASGKCACQAAKTSTLASDFDDQSGPFGKRCEKLLSEAPRDGLAKDLRSECSVPVSTLEEPPIH